MSGETYSNPLTVDPQHILESMIGNPQFVPLKDFFKTVAFLPQFSGDEVSGLGLDAVSVAMRTSGKTSLVQFLRSERSSLMTTLHDKGHLESWIATLEELPLSPPIRFGTRKFPPAEQATPCSNKTSKIFRSGNFLSPDADKDPKGLGEMLRGAGRLGEVYDFFKRPEVYSEVLVKRPTILVKKKRTDTEEWFQITKTFLRVRREPHSHSLSSLPAPPRHCPRNRPRPFCRRSMRAGTRGTRTSSFAARRGAA